MREKSGLIVAMMLITAPAMAETVHIGVKGMVCEFCAKGIEKSFKANPSVEKVDVSLEDKLVTLTTKPDAVIKDQEIKSIFKKAGYDVSSIHHQK